VQLYNGNKNSAAIIMITTATATTKYTQRPPQLMLPAHIDVGNPYIDRPNPISIYNSLIKIPHLNSI